MGVKKKRPAKKKVPTKSGASAVTDGMKAMNVQDSPEQVD
jgi:hypothetical protein